MISTPRAALKAIFARLAGLPACNVVWKGEPEPSVLLAPASGVAITGATNASPIVLTVPQGILVADRSSVLVSGVGGTTAANGGWYACTRVDKTHVSLDGSVGNGAYTSGGTLQQAAFDNTGTLVAFPWRWGLLRVGSSNREAEKNDFNTATDNVDGTSTQTSVGSRRVTLGLDYFSFDPTGSVMADDVLETLRTNLFQGSILEAFNTVNSTPINYGNVLPLPAGFNGTETSAAHLDVYVRLSAIVSQVVDRSATAAGKNTWVHEVKGTGTVTKEGGGTENEPFDVVGS